MKLKIGTIAVCTISLVIILSIMSLVSAQVWEPCIIDAYGTEVDDEMEAGILRFTAVAPPTGSEISNTITVTDGNTGENHTITLADGDSVSMNYENSIYKEIQVAPEAGHYTIYYEGTATFVSVNSDPIPEFSSILIVPLFLIATSLAIAYRRKRNSLSTNNS
jgi:hypothetical protein